MDSTSKSNSPKSGSQSQPSIMIQKMKETIEQTLPINKIPRPISSSGSSNSSKKSNRRRSSSSWHSIQNQQQLLILLFHARTCPEVDNNCPIAGSQCNEAKRMWKHIAEECRDKYNCSHCYTSRYVLTHYRECRDGESCLICSPVREEIKRRKQLQQLQKQQQIMKTADTFSTSMMTPSTTGITTAKVNNVHPMTNNMGGDTNNINETGGNNNGGNNNNAAAGEGGENQKLFPTLTVAICPSADNPFGKIIPVRKASFSSCSSLSHSTTYSALSRGSSSGIPSSIRSVRSGVGGNGGRTKPYFVKDRENPGIAHFLGKD